ncbi:glycosyltransferase family 4 protein [Pontibacter anaerobius]|uniref:Glycosyltransferase family 4 protein n=1 Tax=Pontibacter anaerobius TaxID=2993940 RepID=A0ABT3RJ89_9BACT|nr:glycosyltransferase family 4 protein [Pontibacter anaerobius]MCX2741397.1 glycosyltransferase family 4 protein [Pontibacter anaerobius]
MHIALLNQHHHNPDCPATCRHYTFMEELVQRHRVSLVTSDGWRKTRITHKYSWVPEGVELHEITAPYSNKMGVRKRLKSFAGFAGSAFKRTMQLQKPDVLWAVSTPLSTPWVASQVAKLRGVPWVFEVQDLWPSFPIQMGAVPNSWLQQRLYNMERRLYESASHIITLSPDMTDYIAGLGIPREKITTNYNGTDLDMVDAVPEQEVEEMRSKYKLQGKRVVLYAGTYGRANSMPTLMQTIQSMAADQSIMFVFTGNGYYDPQLKELAQRVPNLLLLPPQPRPDVFKLFKLADVSLVPFNDLPVLASNSPAKFYDSLACGTPTIVTNPGWTKAVVEKYGCGWYTPAEQPEALAQILRGILAQPDKLQAASASGAAVARQLFDRKQLIRQVEEVLLHVVSQFSR